MPGTSCDSCTLSRLLIQSSATCYVYSLILLRPHIAGGAIKRPLQDVTVAESQTAELECEVANPSAEGKWLKDGNPVDFSDNIRSEERGSIRRLVITISRPQDIGEYTYQVASSKTTGNLRVEGDLIYFQMLLHIFYIFAVS